MVPLTIGLCCNDYIFSVCLFYDIRLMIPNPNLIINPPVDSMHQRHQVC